MTAILPTWLINAAKQNQTCLTLPDWLTETRDVRYSDFLKYGLPNANNERFKYTDLSFLTRTNFITTKPNEKNLQLKNRINQFRLSQENAIFLVFLNGFLQPRLSDLIRLPEEVIVCDTLQALKTYGEILKIYEDIPLSATKYPFANLNASLYNSGLFLQVPAHCELPLPIHLLFFYDAESTCMMHPHHILLLGEHSKVTVFEEHVALTESTCWINNMMLMAVKKNAELHYCKIQTNNPCFLHTSFTNINQAEQSQTTLTHFAINNTFSREEMRINLQNAATCQASGLYQLKQDDQYVDYHIDINHLGPYSQSTMLYKGLLAKKSRAVFNGRLYVDAASKKIKSQQANHNLLLSDESEIFSKPELEIYTDDLLQCNHSATTGQLDEAALFYLQSRGIKKEKAMDILLNGFAQEILDKINNEAVKNHVSQKIGGQ